MSVAGWGLTSLSLLRVGDVSQSAVLAVVVVVAVVDVVMVVLALVVGVCAETLVRVKHTLVNDTEGVPEQRVYY